MLVGCFSAEVNLEELHEAGAGTLAVRANGQKSLDACLALYVLWELEQAGAEESERRRHSDHLPLRYSFLLRVLVGVHE